VPNRVQLDATYGNRNGGETGERWFSIGLRLLSVPFLPRKISLSKNLSKLCLTLNIGRLPEHTFTRVKQAGRPGEEE